MGCNGMSIWRHAKSALICFVILGALNGCTRSAQETKTTYRASDLRSKLQAIGESRASGEYAAVEQIRFGILIKIAAGEPEVAELRQLASTDRDPLVRTAALSLVGDSAIPSDGKLLLGATKDSDWRVASVALYALLEMERGAMLSAADRREWRNRTVELLENGDSRLSHVLIECVRVFREDIPSKSLRLFLARRGYWTLPGKHAARTLGARQDAEARRSLEDEIRRLKEWTEELQRLRHHNKSQEPSLPSGR